MNKSQLNTYWQSVLDESKKQLPFPIWENIIVLGLYPLAYQHDTIFLSVMDNYKKYLAQSPQIMNVLITISNTLLNKVVRIEILDIEEANKFMTSPHTSSSTTSTPAPTPEIITAPPTTDLPSFNKNSMYDDPVFVSKEKLIPKTATFSLPEKPFTEITTSQETKKEEINEEALTLNPSFTFKNFVEGNSNRSAAAAAKSIAENPGKSFNPLLIHGPSGLGKTHLMQAIGNYIHQQFPHYKITYLTSETFLNNFVESLRTGQNTLFRNMYRNVDVLLIDDIQFLQTKERGKTQEEFFNTFEALKEANKQIIMTSDVLPLNMQDLPNRLRSRFESGLMVEIREPDMETRLAILRNKYEEYSKEFQNINISDKILTYFAEKLTTNVRTLDGALKQAVMISANQLTPFTLEQGITIIQKLVGNKKAHCVTVELIQEVISQHFGIKKSDLVGTKRKKEIAIPRQIAMFLCRELMELSYPSIANHFNKKDHTTIIYGYEKIKKEISNNLQMQQLINDLKEKIEHP